MPPPRPMEQRWDAAHRVSEEFRADAREHLDTHVTRATHRAALHQGSRINVQKALGDGAACPLHREGAPGGSQPLRGARAHDKRTAQGIVKRPQRRDHSGLPA